MTKLPLEVRNKQPDYCGAISKSSPSMDKFSKFSSTYGVLSTLIILTIWPVYGRLFSNSHSLQICLLALQEPSSSYLNFVGILIRQKKSPKTLGNLSHRPQICHRHRIQQALKWQCLQVFGCDTFLTFYSKTINSHSNKVVNPVLAISSHMGS